MLVLGKLWVQNAKKYTATSNANIEPKTKKNIENVGKFGTSKIIRRTLKY
jgi:hypothetical protein